MKSLVLKDLFNIGHNAKSMLFILVVFAVALIPFSGVEGYIFVCAILCSMMIVTTFSFDDSSKWTRYAKKNALMAQGRYTDAVDEVILKLMKAKKKAFVVCTVS